MRAPEENPLRWGDGILPHCLLISGLKGAIILRAIW
jgi:hypothetical protein